jgi:DNA polymerase-3 subunit delta'
MLPATIRSRCQQLAVRPPPLAEITQWSGRDAILNDTVSLAAPALTPLQWLEALDGEASDHDARWRQELISVLERTASPLTVADSWAKGDADHVLGWLVRMLHGLIRLRCVEHPSKLITESGDPSLHNAARALNLRTLFQRAEEAERLRTDLAGGINVQLAMRALVLGFVSDKGMT